jgi:ABC-type multidrug transport system permease subunit
VIGRILAVLKARNIEFIRDRSSLTWAIVVPFVLVFGLAIVFSGSESDQFTVAVLDDAGAVEAKEHPFYATRFIEFVPVTDAADATRKVGRHQLDLLFARLPRARYWINPESPSGYVVERLLLQSDPAAEREVVAGEAVRYVDWLVPGILGMNMMFGCLFGVGYVVVRYRKNGFLKRLRATPLRAFEFITAQALSRLLLILGVQIVVFAGVKLLLDVSMTGSYLALFLIALLGSTALISLALVVAARIDSEELAGGALNLLTFPMMLLSGVFFSLEGSPAWLQNLAGILPLTPMLAAARAVMIDGAGVTDILPQLTLLLGMTVVFLAVGSALFRWRFV